jgi:hypothetical protein
MSKTPLPDSTDSFIKPELNDEELDDLLLVITLESDLRAVEGKSGKHVEDTLYSKLNYAPVLGIKDFFETEAEDVKEQLTTLIYSHLSADEIAAYESGNGAHRRFLLEQAKGQGRNC